MPTYLKYIFFSFRIKVGSWIYSSALIGSEGKKFRILIPVFIEVEPAECEVIVDAMCGVAVLRGADVFTPGILSIHPPTNINTNVIPALVFPFLLTLIKIFF